MRLGRTRVAVPVMEGRFRILHGHFARRLKVQTGRDVCLPLLSLAALAPGSFAARLSEAGGGLERGLALAAVIS